MTLPIRTAQQQVHESILAAGGYWPPLANLARLMEECGEIARVVNQRFGPKPRKPGEEDVKAAEELADALYVLFALANSLDIDMEDAFASVLAKVASRARGVSPDASA